MKRLLLIAAAAAMLIGCGGKKDDNKGKKPVAATPADAAVAAKDKPADPPGKEEVDVPTAADFEDEATTEITKDNLKDEVKKLEGELPEE